MKLGSYGIVSHDGGLAFLYKGCEEMTDEQIFDVAIKVNGEYEQEEMAIEECGELIVAIRHKHRGRAHNIPEEIADVEICLEQLKMINGCTEEVERIRKEKVERLYDNIFDKCL